MCSNHNHENHASSHFPVDAAGSISLFCSSPPAAALAELRQQPGLPSPPQNLPSPHSHGLVYNMSLHHLTVIFQSQVYFPNLTSRVARYTQCPWFSVNQEGHLPRLCSLPSPLHSIFYTSRSLNIPLMLHSSLASEPVCMELLSFLSNMNSTYYP